MSAAPLPPALGGGGAYAPAAADGSFVQDEESGLAEEMPLIRQPLSLMRESFNGLSPWYVTPQPTLAASMRWKSLRSSSAPPVPTCLALDPNCSWQNGLRH